MHRDPGRTSEPAAGTEVTVSSPETLTLATEAALDPQSRIGPLARGRAIGALQASSGNRAVARRVLARKAVAGPLGTVYQYDRSNFDQRFDANVEPRIGRVTIVCKVKFVLDDVSFPSDYSKASRDKELADFKAGFPAVIKKAWDGKKSLKPGYGGRTLDCLVDPQVVESGEHARIKLQFPKSGFRSGVDKRSAGSTSVTTGTWEIDDLKEEKNTWTDPVSGKAHEIWHNVAAHEFGHVIGIGHIDEKGHHGEAEYGDTYDEAMDIMGYGMRVTDHDMQPWIKAATAYAREVGLPGPDQWTVTTPG